jgi:molybdate transport system substrate-binding protein
MPVRRCLAGLLATLCCALATAAESAPRPVTVFAAASLTDALEQLGDEFKRSTGVTVRFSFAASSVLARQIEAGAGADLFFAADQEWMDYLQQRVATCSATASR